VLKKLIVIGILLIMIISLAACHKNDDLESYKIDANNTLETYAQDKGQTNYSEENWAAICKAVEDGKAAIEAAITKPAATTAVNDAKEVIEGVKMDFIETKFDYMIELHTWHFTSGVPNNAVVVKFTNEEAIFKCVVDKGLLGFAVDSQKELTVKPNDIFYWYADEIIEKAFIEIIVRIDNSIVGYAVIKITENNSHVDHTATVLKSAIFAKVNDEYQDITTEQIKNKINRIKGEN